MKIHIDLRCAKGYTILLAHLLEAIQQGDDNDVMECAEHIKQRAHENVQDKQQADEYYNKQHADEVG